MKIFLQHFIRDFYVRTYETKCIYKYIYTLHIYNAILFYIINILFIERAKSNKKIIYNIKSYDGQARDVCGWWSWIDWIRI